MNTRFVMAVVIFLLTFILQIGADERTGISCTAGAVAHAVRAPDAAPSSFSTFQANEEHPAPFHEVHCHEQTETAVILNTPVEETPMEIVTPRMRQPHFVEQHVYFSLKRPPRSDIALS